MYKENLAGSVAASWSVQPLVLCLTLPYLHLDTSERVCSAGAYFSSEMTCNTEHLHCTYNLSFDFSLIQTYLENNDL
jgi:hypothetical protein